MNGDKPTWTLVAHVGIIGHDRVLISLAAPHFINGCIKETKKLSINLVDEGILPQADYSGSVSGAKEDKSDLFESFICTIDGTYVEEEHLNEQGKIDYGTLKPVLFEFPAYQYLKTGEVIGKCLSFKKAPEK
ncbi:MAG: flavin reductase family protein [Lachnospiraceae bacterium]|nr:flavin reductase family protein [Lachnospiraceae bacterium]